MALSRADDALISRLPKVELHLHIEGTLEPAMVVAKAAKHGVVLRYPSVEALKAAYQFTDLQSFLDLYYAGCDVLRDEEDFYDLAWAYFERAHADKVVHAELFFDPQTHTDRGIAMATVIAGLRRAQAAAERRFGLTSKLILCFLRHQSEEAAFATLDAARPFLHAIAGVGLDSGEQGNPPSKFARVFAAARALGLSPVAHAGEEGPPAYIREALDVLDVVRIDHGVRCDEEPALVEELARSRVPLTVCPLSNVKLCVYKTMADHNLARLLAAGLCVTVNSDDPAYFGGYIADNYRAVADALPIGAAELVQLARNAVEASWLHADRKDQLQAAIDEAAEGAL
ncbi:MAG TPA: adenosine deaminase [Kofleriaceae bacterium]|nr:adenosine deaminase [Kofleriaceae bacterium]